MTASRNLYILGAGGLAREMALLAEQVEPPPGVTWRFAGFIGGPDDAIGTDTGEGEVVGDDEWLIKHVGDADVVIGIGHPAVRQRVVSRLLPGAHRLRFPNLIHPSVVIDTRRVDLGRGNCITAGCILTTNIRLGDFNLLNWNVTIGHDVRIGSYSVINPGSNVSGGVTLGDATLIGTGARVLENLCVAESSSVGAGAVVTRDVPAGATVVGVPARLLVKD